MLHTKLQGRGRVPWRPSLTSYSGPGSRVHFCLKQLEYLSLPPAGREHFHRGLRATGWHRFLFLKCLLSVLLLIHPRYYYSSASSQILSWHKFKGSMSSILPTFSSYFSDPSRKQMTWGAHWLKWLQESFNSHFPYSGIKMGLYSYCFTSQVTSL